MTTETDPTPLEPTDPTPDTTPDDETDDSTPTPDEATPQPNEPDNEGRAKSYDELLAASENDNTTGDMTPEKLQAELNAYAEAIRQEYETGLKLNAAASDPDQHHKMTELTINYFKDNIASAAANIVWLSNNAESETARLNASKFIVAQALSDAKQQGDPIKDLLTELTRNTDSPVPQEN